ncbi:glycosyltransferase [Sporolactobacillus pectinivorans]|uniref:glycosyltransferase n=1 Tax=Sporolactobacillus pectinivorans TaxID=1591408 RepID=UPI001EFE35EF|nr:glycosyltransferase [Sporolactobacillus pectinivorans]
MKKARKNKEVFTIKILYLIHQFFPETYTGTENFLLNLAGQIKTNEHDVKIITHSFQTDSYFEHTYENIMYREFLYNDIPIIAYKHINDPGPQTLYQSLEDSELTGFANMILEKEQPDIVHIAHPIRMGEFVNVAIKRNIPYLITLTDFFMMCPKGILMTSSGSPCLGAKQGDACRTQCPEINNEFVKYRYKQSENILLSAKKVIAPSFFLAKMFREEFPEVDIEVIKYGINTEKCIQNKTVYTKNQKLTFCYAGSHYYHKGLHVLIKAFLNLKIKKAKLKIYGSGNIESYNNQIRKSAYKNSNIEFCGVYDETDIGKIFSESDVLIVPSIWHENCPFVVYEALACRLPVVASDVGGITEIIDHGQNGFIFPRNNSEKLTRILKKLIKGPKRLNGIKKNIKNEKVRTVQEEANEYLNLYRSMNK